MFKIGFLTIHLYSVCILLGILCAYFLCVSEGKRHNISKDEMSDLIFYIVICGIVGARIYYCLFNLNHYLYNPISLFKVWEGGLAIHGGLIGGLSYLIYWCKKRNKNVLLVLDIIVVGLILGQSIGRWGNFFNGEAHGPITTLSYLKSLYLPKFIINGMYIDGNYYVPTFLYESLWCLLGFIVLFFIRRCKFVKIGYLTSFYLLWYSIERLFIESLRTDSLMFFSIKVAQAVSIFMIIIGVIIFTYSFFKNDCYEGDD